MRGHFLGRAGIILVLALTVVSLCILLFGGGAPQAPPVDSGSFDDSCELLSGRQSDVLDGSRIQQSAARVDAARDPSEASMAWRGAKLVVAIVDDNGEAQASVGLVLRSRTAGVQALLKTTGSDGVAFFTNLNKGEVYDLTVESPQLISREVVMSDWEVRLQQVVASPYRVVVQVVDEDEMPVPGARVVRWWPTDGLDRMVRMEARGTADDGKCEFKLFDNSCVMYAEAPDGRQSRGQAIIELPDLRGTGRWPVLTLVVSVGAELRVAASGELEKQQHYGVKVSSFPFFVRDAGGVPQYGGQPVEAMLGESDEAVLYLPRGPYRVALVNELGDELVAKLVDHQGPSSITLDCPSVKTISGVVRDMRGRAVPGARLIVAGDGIAAPIEFAAGPDGRFHRTGLPIVPIKGGVFKGAPGGVPLVLEEVVGSGVVLGCVAPGFLPFVKPVREIAVGGAVGIELAPAPQCRFSTLRNGVRVRVARVDLLVTDMRSSHEFLAAPTELRAQVSDDGFVSFSVDPACYYRCSCLMSDGSISIVRSKSGATWLKLQEVELP